MPEIINQQIATLRKNKGITQEELAGHLGVTNQTVSKWELAACCPDIQLLPVIADYFDVTIDELFGRDDFAKAESSSIESVPWDDDGILRAVIFIGKKLMKKTNDLSEFTFEYEGEALNIECQCNINCNDVGGKANAGRDISCNDVCGNVNSGASLTCNDIDGNVTAGSSISCNDICGSVTAGGSINCGDIDGDILSGDI